MNVVLMCIKFGFHGRGETNHKTKCPHNPQSDHRKLEEKEETKILWVVVVILATFEWGKF